MYRVSHLRALALAASTLFLIAGSPARATTTVDTAVPDWIEDTTDRVACTTGSTCTLKIQSWITTWGCYSETLPSFQFSHTMCQVFANGPVTATTVPNGPCTLTMINTLQISFVSGVSTGLGGTWHQAATFVPVDNTAIGTTKYRVTMHGGGPFEGQTAGAGSLSGAFDLVFPAPGVLRSNCKSAAPGTLVPTLNDSRDTDGTVIHILGDSIQ